MPLLSRTSLADSWRSITTLLRRRAVAPTSSVRNNITYLTASVLSSVQPLVPLSPTSDQPEDSMAYRTHSRDLDNTYLTASVASSVQHPVPLPPTSEQPEDSVAYRTYIHNLDNDSLLEIFSCFRLEDEEAGISDLRGESLPTFVEDGGTSSLTYRPTCICVFLSALSRVGTIPLQ